MTHLPERRFVLICVLSLALHLLAFAVAAWQRPAAPAPLPPLLASLRLIPISEPGPTAPVVRPAAEAASRPASLAAAVPPKARPRPTPAAPPSAPRGPEAAGPAYVPADPAASAPAPAAVPAAATPAVALAAEPVPAPRPQAELLAGYRQRLAELFARQQEYPRLAALRGWEGEVRLRLKVARKGNLLDVQLDRSSGFEILDRHALAMLERLPLLPPLPEALEAAEIQVVVPIHYKLRKTT